MAALQMTRENGGRVRLLHAIDELAYLSGFEYSGQVLEAARAIGTHGRRGMSRALLGSGAEQVLRLAPVPVLAVRTPEKSATA